jgi:hypothetical protein
METFQECGVQMLREFRALLQQTPLPVNQTRLLQLLALNMFAVSNTQLKGKQQQKKMIHIKDISCQLHPRNISITAKSGKVLDRLFRSPWKPLALQRKKKNSRKEKQPK